MGSSGWFDPNGELHRTLAFCAMSVVKVPPPSLPSHQSSLSLSHSFTLLQVPRNSHNDIVRLSFAAKSGHTCPAGFPGKNDLLKETVHFSTTLVAPERLTKSSDRKGKYLQRQIRVPVPSPQHHPLSSLRNSQTCSSRELSPCLYMVAVCMTGCSFHSPSKNQFIHMEPLPQEDCQLAFTFDQKEFQSITG